MGTPNFIAALATFGWIPLSIVLFALVRPVRRAVAVCYVAGWLFLPMAKYELPELPDFSKAISVSFGALLGVAIFDAGRLLSIRPRQIDVPMIAWCLVPIATSVSNGLGIYDGVSESLTNWAWWGVPYFLGRLYFNDLSAARDLAMGIVVGGIVYVPLCLWEVRMSPQLHVWLYGFRQHEWSQVFRFGGYRPMVFMQHGLAVGMWMAAATLLAYWMWAARSVRAIRGMPMALVTIGLLVTTIACKSTYAILLGIMGAGALWLARVTRVGVFVALIALVPPVYIAGRTVAGFTGEPLVQLAAMIGPERAESLRTRLNSENLLYERVMERPLLGWGGHGRQQVMDDTGRMVAIPDGLWIIVLGKHGWVGLIAMTAAVMGPALLLVGRFRARQWDHPLVAPAMGVAVVMLLFMCDSLMNAMLNPVFLLGAGGLGARKMGRTGQMGHTGRIGVARPALAA